MADLEIPAPVALRFWHSRRARGRSAQEPAKLQVHPGPRPDPADADTAHWRPKRGHDRQQDGAQPPDASWLAEGGRSDLREGRGRVAPQDGARISERKEGLGERDCLSGGFLGTDRLLPRLQAVDGRQPRRVHGPYLSPEASIAPGSCIPLVRNFLATRS